MQTRGAQVGHRSHHLVHSKTPMSYDLYSYYMFAVLEIIYYSDLNNSMQCRALKIDVKPYLYACFGHAHDHVYNNIVL